MSLLPSENAQLGGLNKGSPRQDWPFKKVLHCFIMQRNSSSILKGSMEYTIRLLFRLELQFKRLPISNWFGVIVHYEGLLCHFISSAQRCLLQACKSFMLFNNGDICMIRKHRPSFPRTTTSQMIASLFCSIIESYLGAEVLSQLYWTQMISSAQGQIHSSQGKISALDSEQMMTYLSSLRSQ